MILSVFVFRRVAVLVHGLPEALPDQARAVRAQARAHAGEEARVCTVQQDLHAEL